MPSFAFRRVLDRKSTRLNSSHTLISYAVFCLKKNTTEKDDVRQGGGQHRGETPAVRGPARNARCPRGRRAAAVPCALQAWTSVIFFFKGPAAHRVLHFPHTPPSSI